MAGEFRAFAAKFGTNIDEPQKQEQVSAFQAFSQKVAQRKTQRAQNAFMAGEQGLWNKIQNLPQTNNSSELRELVSKEGARFGSDFQREAIAAIDHYETTYPGSVFESAMKQHIPGDLEDWRSLTKETAEQKIREYEGRIAQEEQKRASKYHYYSEEELDKMTPAEQLAALNSEGIKGASSEEFDADSRLMQSLKDELEKYKKYDTILSLQKETRAYENLSEEDKRLVSQMAQIEAAGKKLQYEKDTGGSVMGIMGTNDTKKSINADRTDYDRYNALRKELVDKGVWSQDLQDYISRVGNYLQTGVETDQWREYTKEHPVLSNLASILMKPAAAIGTAANAIGTNIGNAVSGDSKPIDVYAPENLGSNIVNEIRGTSSEMILGDDPNAWKQAFEKGYQLLMSTGDSALTIPMAFIPTVGPALAAGTMGIEAGADTALDASMRGGSASQALSAGILAGAAEALFERYSIGKLIDTAKASRKGFKALVKSTLANAGVNAQEEAATEIANIISDTLVMQDKSHYNQSVEQYMKDGMSREEAETKANWDLISQVTESALGGAFQGLVMGGVGNTLSYLRSASDTRAYGNAVRQQAGSRDALLDAAGQFPNNADVQKAAAALRKKDSAANVGKLAYQLQQQTGKPIGGIISAYNESAVQGNSANPAGGSVQAERITANPVESILSGKTITSSQADRIVKSPALSKAFTEITGKSLEGLAASAARQVVKESAGFTSSGRNGTINTNQYAPAAIQQGAQNGGVPYVGQQGNQAGGYAGAAGANAAGYGYGAGGQAASDNQYRGNMSAAERIFQQDNPGRAGTDGAGSQDVGGFRRVRPSQRYRGLDPTFGQTPNKEWAKNTIVSPQEGSISQAEQQIASEYAVPCFVVADDAWASNKGDTPAFSEDGQIYLRESQGEGNRGALVYHELTHVMKQLGFQPYLDFIQRTPDLLDTNSSAARNLIGALAEYRGIDPFSMSDSERTTLYDEINATVYGAYRSGNTTAIDYLRNAFYDFDAYIAELSGIHQQFKDFQQQNNPEQGAPGQGGSFFDGENGTAQDVQAESAFQEIDLNEGPDDLIEATANTMLGYATTEGRRKVQRIGERLGLKVVFDLYGDPAVKGEAYLQGDTIHMNPRAAQPLFQLFKHELTHFAERSKLYNDFANAIMDSQAFRKWVQSKGYDSVAAYNTAIAERYRSLLKDPQYGEHEANLEMLARYVSETLYQGDTTGMAALLASLDEQPRRSFIQWVKDFIQHIKEKLQRSTQKTAAQLLEQQFSKVLLDAQKNTAQQDGVARYSLNGYSQHQIDNWAHSKSIVVYKSQDQLRQFIRDAVNGVNLNKKMYFGSIPTDLAARIQSDTGLDVAGYNCTIAAQEIRKIFKDHGTFETENLRGQRPITDKDIMSIPEIIQAPDNIVRDSRDYNGRPVIKFTKELNGRTTVTAYVSGKHLDLMVQTMYSGKNKGNLATPASDQALANTPEASRGTVPINSIRQNQKNVNVPDKSRKYSMPMNPAEIADLTEEDASTTPPLNHTERAARGDGESNFYDSVQASSILDDAFKNQAADNKFLKHYERISNKETMQAAKKALDEGGAEYVNRWMSKKPHELDTTDRAAGFILLDRYQKVGDYNSAMGVLNKLREAGTESGQETQIFALLGRLTPEAMTFYAQKSLSEAFDIMVKGQTQKWIDANKDRFQLSGEDIDFIRRRTLQAAHLPEGRDKQLRLAEIAACIQDKLPPEKGQNIRALQRISMLLNPKTNIRNIQGNAIMVPTYWLSDTIGAAIDKAVSKKTDVRTTGLFQFGKDTANAFKEGLFNSWDDFVRHVNTRDISADRWDIGQGKSFNEHHTGKLSKPFNALSKALNALDRTTSFLLDAGDRSFFQMWFINSLNNQMRLNSVSEPTAHMIEIATLEAQQRTWQDSNALSKFVGGLKKGMNHIQLPAVSLDLKSVKRPADIFKAVKFSGSGYGLGDFFVKFAKTPANLTKAIVDFSPAGVIKAITIDATRLTNAIETGQYTPMLQKRFVDSLSKGITGTILYAIFYGLASAGILTGGGDEDKDANAFNRYIRGVQPYSVKIGDYTFSYEWAQPIGAMMAIMSDYVQEKNANEDGEEFNAIKKAIQAGGRVLFNQSFMQSIQNLFKDDNIMQNIIDGLLDEPAVFVPQILSQTANVFDDKARVTYEYGKPLQTAVNKVLYKIPGARNTLPVDTDVLGRERKNPQHDIFNAYFNPANTYASETTPSADEIYRLYQKTGEKSVFPQKAPNYITYNNKKHVLSAEQKTKYQQITGGDASRYVSELSKNSTYKKMSDGDKVDLMQKLYSYTAAKAKESVLDDYEMSSSNAAIKQMEDAGVSAADQLLIKATADTDGNDSISDKEYYKALLDSALDKWAKDMLEEMRKAQRIKDKELRKERMEDVVERYGK